jgi:hypothetical protein
MVHAVGNPLMEGRPIVANLSSVRPHLGVRALPGLRPILYVRSNLDGRSNPCVQGRPITALLSGQDPAFLYSNWFMRKANYRLKLTARLANFVRPRSLACALGALKLYCRK